MTRLSAIAVRSVLTPLLVGVMTLCFSAPPALAGTSDLTRQFQATLERFQKNNKLPGITAAYVLPNGFIGAAATGFSDRRTGSPMTPKSRMLAASIGKTFVAATVIALAHDELLGLDDPVSTWLADREWFTRLPNHDSMTIRHLLNHSSGLPDHVHSAAFHAAASKRWRGNENPFPPAALIAFVLDQPPLFEAGRGWSYSDTGFILLGLIIEKATAQDYYDVVEARFIASLELVDTSPSNRPDLQGLATGYMDEENLFGFPPETTSSPGMMVWNPGVEWTGGGLVSTSSDLAKWGSALFAGKAMSGAYLGDLLSAVSIDSTNSDVQYGLGVAIHRGGAFGPVYGHAGWIPGYSSSLRYYADHDVCIAFQINTDIGIVDSSSSIVQELELALAELVIKALASD